MKILWAVLLVLAGCPKPRSAEKPPPPPLSSEPPPLVVAETPTGAPPVEGPAPRATAAPAPAGPSWAETVAQLATELDKTIAECNEKWLTKLHPDDLVIGKSPIPVTDGILTVMDETCKSAVERLPSALELLEGKHPDTEALLREWTLWADLYARASLSSMNIGSTEKRRKLNSDEMKAYLPMMTGPLTDRLLAAGKKLEAWPKDTLATAAPAPLKLAPDEATAEWKKRVKATVADARELHETWTTEGHDLLAADVFARARHLAWLGRAWHRRLDEERAALEATTTGDPAVDGKLRDAVRPFYVALEQHLTGGYEASVTALDMSTVDMNVLKAMKKGFEKSYAGLEKVARELKL